MARVRSPAYPALSLPAAVDLIRKVHQAQQSTPEPREVVLRHMGYSSENGRALKAISALIKYGFLDSAGNDGLRVSDMAVAIIYPDPDDSTGREKALLSAARKPALFRTIFDRWDGKPSEDSLKAFLIREGFNVNYVDSVARAFYETYELVSGIDDSYDSSGDEPDDIEDETVQNSQETKDGPGVFKKAKASPEAASLNVTKPVFDFETVRVQTVIDNQDDLAELISRLEKLKSMLPPKMQH